jgi:hypothetical protein
MCFSILYSVLQYISSCKYYARKYVLNFSKLCILYSSHCIGTLCYARLFICTVHKYILYSVQYEELFKNFTPL